MIWVLALLLAAGAGYFLFKHRHGASALGAIDNTKQQALALSEHERFKLAADCRTLALAGYDRGHEAALSAGKSEQIAHQVGVTEAVYAVLANSNEARRDSLLRPKLEMEGMPFNVASSSDGRAAITEYLVWKFFPSEADAELVRIGLRNFVTKVFDNSENEPQPDQAIYRMIYSGQYDWQPLAQDVVKEMSRTEDA